jgi:hypothetical protein
MSPIFDENGTELDLQDLIKSQGIRDKMKDIPKMEARITELEGQLATKDREFALARAGLPNTKMADLFVKAYDGPADPDSVRKAAEEYGLISTSPTTSTEDNEQAAELERLRRASGSGGEPAEVNESRELQQQIAKARNASELEAIMDSELAQRVIARERAGG